MASFILFELHNKSCVVLQTLANRERTYEIDDKYGYFHYCLLSLVSTIHQSLYRLDTQGAFLEHHYFVRCITMCWCHELPEKVWHIPCTRLKVSQRWLVSQTYYHSINVPTIESWCHRKKHVFLDVIAVVIDTTRWAGQRHLDCHMSKRYLNKEVTVVCLYPTCACSTLRLHVLTTTHS